MTTPHIDIDECVQRYIAAFDEIAYLAEKLAPHMGIATHNELAKDFFKKIDFEIMEHPVAQLLNAARELSKLRKGEHPDFVMVPRDIIKKKYEELEDEVQRLRSRLLEEQKRYDAIVEDKVIAAFGIPSEEVLEIIKKHKGETK